MVIKNKYKNINNWIRSNLKKHLVDSTALLLIASPISSAVEIGIVGMSYDVSINARILGTTLTYLGFGSLFSRVGDFSKKILNINDDANEKIHAIHDTIYPVVLALAVNPPFYLVSGSRDVREIAIATGMAAALSIPLGYPARLAIDAFRDSTGIQKSERALIRKINPKIRKGLIGLIAAGSIVGTMSIYGLTSPKERDYELEKLPKAHIIEEYNSPTFPKKYLP